MGNVQQKVLSGAALMLALRLCVKSMGLVSSIFLARLLMPEDFGLIAIVMSVYAFIELLNAFGFDVSLIQNQKATDEHYNTSWTFKVIFALLACVIMVVAAHPMAEFYGDPRLVELAYCLSVMFVLNGASNIGVVNFRKHLDFKKEFMFEFLTKLFSVLITVSLAFYLKSYWALVIGMLSNATIRFMLSYYMNGYRPWFCISKWKELYKFSSWLLINNVLIYMNLKIKDLIIGRYAGVSQVGFYSIADEFANLPSTEFVASVNRATYPGYAKVADNMDELKQLYVNVLSSISFIGIAASAGIALVAPIFVPVVLGEKWLEIIPILHLLAIAGAFMSVNTNVGYVFIALGKPKLTTAILTLRVTILISLLVWLTQRDGLLGAAHAVLYTSIIMFPISTLAICLKLKLSIVRYLGVVIKPTISSVVMYLLGSQVIYDHYQVPMVVNIEHYNVLDLLIAVMTGGGIFVVTAALLWFAIGRPKGPEQFVFEKLTSTLAKAR